MCKNRFPTQNIVVETTGANGVETIVGAMRQLIGNVNAQRCGCQILNYLTKSLADVAVRVGGTELVIVAMQQHPDDVDLQQYGCDILADIAFHETYREFVGNAGGIQAVVTAMRTHTSRLAVQVNGLRALININACEASHDLKFAIKGPAIDVVVAAMQCYGDNMEIQRFGCWALVNLKCGRYRIHQDTNLQDISPETDSDRECYERYVIKAGGIKVTVNAMKRFPENADIQRFGCNIFAEAVIFLTSDRIQMFEIVIAAIRRHQTNESVQLAGCSCLQYLQHEDQLHVVKIGGIEAILNAIQDHHDNVQCVRAGCEALVSLCENHSEIQSLVVKAGAIKILTSLFQGFRRPSHPQGQDRGVFCSASKALAALCSNHHENQNFVAECGGIELVMESLRLCSDKTMSGQRSGIHFSQKICENNIANMKRVIMAGGIQRVVTFYATCKYVIARTILESFLDSIPRMMTDCDFVLDGVNTECNTTDAIEIIQAALAVMKNNESKTALQLFSVLVLSWCDLVNDDLSSAACVSPSGGTQGDDHTTTESKLALVTLLETAAMPAVTNVMRAHASDVIVQQCGLKALTNFAASVGSAEDMIELVRTVMHAHLECAQLQRDGCWALAAASLAHHHHHHHHHHYQASILPQDSGSEDPLIGLTVGTAVRTAMSAHPTAAAVQHAGCAAL